MTVGHLRNIEIDNAGISVCLDNPKAARHLVKSAPSNASKVLFCFVERRVHGLLPRRGQVYRVGALILAATFVIHASDDRRALLPASARAAGLSRLGTHPIIPGAFPRVVVIILANSTVVVSVSRDVGATGFSVIIVAITIARRAIVAITIIAATTILVISQRLNA